MSIAYLTCCVATLAGLPGSTSAGAQPAASSTPALRDGSHDMDFNFGTWHTEIIRVADPFGDPAKVVHMAGTVTVKPIWNGKAELEEIEAEGPKGHWEGANLFFYDLAAHQWNQHYIGSSEGRFDEPAGIGEYRNGKVEYYSADKVGGRAVLDRTIWTVLSPDAHTYEESLSDDGGRTWRPAFIAHLTRIGK
jgi:hypothetical protein